jgi:tetratricopeptide (TPR) repeat protein
MLNHTSKGLLAGLLALAHWITTVAAQDTLREAQLNSFQGQGRPAITERPRESTPEETEKIAYQVRAQVILLINLAELYAAQNKHSQAELLYRQWLDKEEKALGAEHPDVVTMVNGLAFLYAAQGKYSQAELLYQQWIAKMEKAREKQRTGLDRGSRELSRDAPAKAPLRTP